MKNAKETREKVFISYANRERAFVEQLVKELSLHGYEAQADWMLKQGTDWKREIRHGLQTADAVLLVVGRGPRGEQRQEWAVALEAKWKDPQMLLIPILLDNARVPSFLSRFPALKTDPDDVSGAVKKVLRAFAAARSGPDRRPVRADREESLKRGKRLEYIEKAAESLRSR